MRGGGSISKGACARCPSWKLGHRMGPYRHGREKASIYPCILIPLDFGNALTFRDPECTSLGDDGMYSVLE